MGAFNAATNKPTATTPRRGLFGRVINATRTVLERNAPAPNEEATLLGGTPPDAAENAANAAIAGRAVAERMRKRAGAISRFDQPATIGKMPGYRMSKPTLMGQ